MLLFLWLAQKQNELVFYGKMAEQQQIPSIHIWICQKYIWTPWTFGGERGGELIAGRKHSHYEKLYQKWFL